MRTAIYVRVSTEEQAQEGYSIDAQKEKLSQYCYLHDFTIANIYVDEGISGKSLERPRVKEMIKDIKKGLIDNVLIYKLDRLTRSLKDLINLVDLFEKYDVHFTSMSEKIDTSTANGRMFLQLMGVLAEWERGVIGERVVFGMEQRAREGIYTAPGNPFGFTYVDGHYCINEREASVIRLIYDLYLSGKGFATIRRYLNQENIKTKRGATWTSNAVSLILNRPYYAGYFYYKNDKEELIKATNIDPIIEKEKWDKCRKIASSKAWDAAKKYSRDEFIFHGPLQCSCGRSFGTVVTKPNKKHRSISFRSNYYCPNVRDKRCDQSTFTIARAEEMFLDFLKKIKQNPLEYQVQVNSKKKSDINKEIINLNNDLDKANNRKKKLHYLLLDESIDNNSYLELLNEITNDINDINNKINKANNEIMNIDNGTEYNNNLAYSTKILNVWNEMEVLQKKEFIKTFFKKIIVKGDQVVEVEYI